MTKEELVKKLKKLGKSRDPEEAHVEADRLLIEFINDSDIEKSYQSIFKYYV